MNLSPSIFVNVLYLFWFLVLTFFVVRFYLYYARLTKDGKKESLPRLLDDLLKDRDETKKALEILNKKYDTLENEGNLHIQKVGLERFNPFKDTGGDQSFVLALVDKEDTGVIISSLHTRTGTRWYAKKVMKGKGSEYELSDEEQKALKGAASLKEEK